MKYQTFVLALLITLLLNSCKEEKKEPENANFKAPSTEISRNTHNETSEVEIKQLYAKLQGNWKEPEYPFGVIKFKDSLVKIIEEGVVEAPRFKKYTLSGECKFRVTNNKDLESRDIVLVLLEEKTCEKIEISNDTLILSGFSTHLGEDYNRIYIRTE